MLPGWDIPRPPTVINHDYNMIKQLCTKRIYDKIRSKSPSNWATLPTSIHCDVRYVSLITGVEALNIPSWNCVFAHSLGQPLIFSVLILTCGSTQIVLLAVNDNRIKYTLLAPFMWLSFLSWKCSEANHTLAVIGYVTETILLVALLCWSANIIIIIIHNIVYSETPLNNLYKCRLILNLLNFFEDSVADKEFDHICWIKFMSFCLDFPTQVKCTQKFITDMFNKLRLQRDSWSFAS